MTHPDPVQDKAHALYRFYDRAGALLYVGITVDPGRRFERHRTDKPWWQDVARVELEAHSSRDAVLVAERAAVAQESPRYNIKLQRNGTPPTSAALEVTDGPSGLIGRHFHSWREIEDGEDTSMLTIRRGRVLEWQGRIVERPEIGLYLAELFSWWDGMPNGQRLVHTDDMARWTFYDDALEMQASLGCREVRGGREQCGGEISRVVFSIIGTVMVCGRCADHYAGDTKELVWVDGKPRLP